jgi:hypothetical protein
LGTTAIGLVVGVLATWRVTHLLQAEDGPGDALVRLRRAAGDGFWGSLLDCFYCLSLWVAAPFAAVTGSTWLDRGMLWLAISGGACLLERVKPGAPAALYVEDREAGADGLLRQQAIDDGPAEPGAGADPSGPSGGARGEPAAPGGAGSDPGEGV